MSLPSVMNHSFSNLPNVGITRSVFNRSHGHKMTFDAGKLYPCYIDEVLPGDTHTVRLSHFCRMATPKLPLMDNLYITFHFWFVPNRLCYSDWEHLMGAQDNPGDSIDFLVPQIRFPDGVDYGTMGDYFGLPLNYSPDSGINFEVNAIPFRAYNRIWRDWYRSQDLSDSPVIKTDAGPDSPNDYPLRYRAKRHDYFTSCLPWPQKGADILVPIGASAPVLWQATTGNPLFVNKETGLDGTTDFTGGSNIFTNFIMQGVRWSGQTGGELSIGNDENPPGEYNYPSNGGVSYNPAGSLFADLTAATAATVNQVREAFQLQRMLEKDARGGTRYTEILQNHFEVTSPDFRLQRPEYLGGGESYVNMNPVANTVGTASAEQGKLAAYATSSGTDIGFSQSFTEHGFIIGLVSVRADLTYQRGLHKMWSRQTREDHYWPSLAMLGEQEVLSKEIWCDGSPDDDLVWGYQERFAEYRYKNSMITGKFRSFLPSPTTGSLDVWHLSENFEDRPTLSELFIQSDPPMERILAVTDEPQFLMDMFYNVKSVRPLPVFGVPGMVDHF